MCSGQRLEQNLTASRLLQSGFHRCGRVQHFGRAFTFLVTALLSVHRWSTRVFRLLRYKLNHRARKLQNVPIQEEAGFRERTYRAEDASFRSLRRKPQQ
jgi:hypothetical protein